MVGRYRKWQEKKISQRYPHSNLYNLWISYLIGQEEVKVANASNVCLEMPWRWIDYSGLSRWTQSAQMNFKSGRWRGQKHSSERYDRLCCHWLWRWSKRMEAASINWKIQERKPLRKKAILPIAEWNWAVVATWP